MIGSKQCGSRRLNLEALEGRTMLSATPLAMPTVSLVPGQTVVSSARVSQAIQAVDTQLLTTPVGSPQKPISIDLDQDGVPDTISLTQPPGGAGNVLHVLFGGSELHPSFEATMALDYVVRRLMVGDFEGDGRSDIFAAKDDTGAGTLLLARPDGLFDAYSQQEGQTSFAVADLNADGANDFVYSNGQSSQVKIDMASGPARYAGEAGALPSVNVQLTDLATDGVRDLAVTRGDGSVEVYSGLGKGRFSSQPKTVADLFAGTGTVHVAFAHLGDQAGVANPTMDMVVASTALSEVAVFLGQKDGSLQQEQIIPVGLAPTSVSVQDVSGDGIPDLLVTSAGTDSLWILRGLGNGQFDAAHPLILTTGDDPVGVYAGDFTDDGKMDVVTLDRGSDEITYFKNMGGTFAPPEQIDSGGTGPVTAVVLNGGHNGYSDLVVANRDDGRVTIFNGSPTGLREGQTIERTGSNPMALAVGPGMQSGYEVYVLYENMATAEIVTFDLLLGEATPMSQAEAPALESPAEVRIVLQQVAGTSVAIVPTLPVKLPETDEPIPLVGKPKQATNPVQGAAGIAGKPAEVPPTEESSGSALERAAQRYLLGVDEVPAPSLEPIGMISSLASVVRTESGSEGLTDEPSRPAMRKDEAIPSEDAEFEAAAEEKTMRESGVLADEHLLVGVLLMVGLPIHWAKQSTFRSQFVALYP